MSWYIQYYLGEYYKAKVWKPEREQDRHHATRLTEKTGVDVLKADHSRAQHTDK